MSTGYIVLPDTGGAGDSPIATVGNTQSVSLNIVAEDLTGTVNIAASGTAAASGYFAALTEIKADGLFVSAPQSGVRASTLTGYAAASGAVAATDTVLQGFDKLGYYVSQHSSAQVITVAVSGGNFTQIQPAIDSITDASATKQYLIKVMPGNYAPFVAKAYCNISGEALSANIIGIDAPAITATLAPTETVAIVGLTFLNYCATEDGFAASFVGDVNCDQCGFYLIKTNDTAGVCCKTSAETLQVMGSCTFASTALGAVTTKNIDGLRCNGSGAMSIFLSSCNIELNASSGDTCCIDENGTGERNYNNILLRYTNTNAGFTGVAKGFCVSSKSTGVRLSQASQVRLTGAGAGTAYAFFIDSATNDASYFHTNSVCVIDGFATEGISFTGLGDVQRVWLSSPTKNIGKFGTGLSVITPLDKDESGFVEWGPEATYWAYDTGTATFTVNKSGAGCVKGAPMTWAAGQSVVLTDRAVNYVYMDDTGTIGVATSGAGLYHDNVVLFEVWREGINYIVAKENHPFKFSSAVSTSWHHLFGTLLQDATQTLAINSAANRTVNLVGSNTLTDHGLDTTIDAQTPISFRQVVYGASGKMVQIAAAVGIVSVKSNTTDTGVNVANGRYIVYRLGVTKESLNSATPTFITVADNTDSSNLSGANSRITSGVVLSFPAEAKSLEIAQLGFAIVQANGAGAGTLSQVTTALQVFGAAFVSGGTSTSAALITTSTTNFNNLLSGTDTNVQLALDTLDNFIALPSDATNASLSPDLINNAAFATSASGTSATFTFGTQGAIEFLIDANTSGGMTIACDYKATGVNAISDPSNLFLATDAGTGIVVTKPANSAAVTIKNRLGVNTAIGVLAIRASGTATAWS